MSRDLNILTAVKKKDTLKLMDSSRLAELESRNMKVFFAHPYSSYERGTNENTNGLIREFLPKGKSMNGKEKEIPEIQKILNERCRKILNYRSAEEYHFDNTIA